MLWDELFDTIDRWSDQCIEPARRLRKAASRLPTVSDIGWYWNPVLNRSGVYSVDSGDEARAIKAAGSACRLGLLDLADPDGAWVKVAYSPTIHRAGEMLNFFPGQYAGGVPNSPSPLAAMLTSGLLGAGLGWAGGHLAGKALPHGYGDNLGRTGAMLGGLAGLTPGLLWGGANKLDGRNFNDPSILAGQPGAEPDEFGSFRDGSNQVPQHHAPEGLGHNRQLEEMYLAAPHQMMKRSEELAIAAEPLIRPGIRAAVQRFAKSAWAYSPPGLPRLPTDVNIDHLGRTLWEAGAAPAMTASTMGAMYAARQFPDPYGGPNIVTGNQLGQLAANSIGDYAKGYAVGAAINGLIGTPYSAPAFGVGNIAINLLGAVVPKLFGN